MKGVLLCKFDEERGYIPTKAHPPKIRKRKNIELFKKIARNAIGFGTQVEFQAFTISADSSEIHCLAKRFSLPVNGARGGSELYALVIISENEKQLAEESPKKLLTESSQRLLVNWESRNELMAELFESLNPSRVEPITSTVITETQNSPRSIFPQELLIEKKGFFADGATISRNLLMLLSIVTLFWVFYSNYNLFSLTFMVTIGLFVFTIITKKDKPLKIANGFLFFFIILLFIKLFFDLIGDPLPISFLGSFPDFRPDLALLSFFSGILICLGLDRGVAVDKASFIIGICGLVFLILFFFTPLFNMLFALFQ